MHGFIFDDWDDGNHSQLADAQKENARLQTRLDEVEELLELLIAAIAEQRGVGQEVGKAKRYFQKWAR